MNIFYDHLVNIYELHLEFDRLSLPIGNRRELMRLADSAVHHEVFNLLMVEIPEEHKAYFLEVFAKDPGDEHLLAWLKEKTPGIEDKIKDRASLVKSQLIQEIRNIDGSN
jgi:hypothetical protein